MAGYRAKYSLAAKLVNEQVGLPVPLSPIRQSGSPRRTQSPVDRVLMTELVEAADEKQLTKTIARYGRVDLLCIDELGYLELDRRGAEMIFQVLTEREEKDSVAIASNASFSEWGNTFSDPWLCSAIIDRLTFNGTIIETGSESYRLAHSKACQNVAPTH